MSTENDVSASTAALIGELGQRLKADYNRMKRWRQFHRLTGMGFTLVLVAVPPIVAAGILTSESLFGKLLLLVVTIVAAFNSVFQPLAHSELRRQDMSRMRFLYDQFRADLADAADDDAKQIALFKDYSKRFAHLYRCRGKRLLDAFLASRQSTPEAASTDAHGAKAGRSDGG